uniref:Uncharacterized protein n=1 Tax=Rhizophora mucronata TaxID=61149 RepID=A0A2P2LA87_RHIMU
MWFFKCQLSSWRRHNTYNIDAMDFLFLIFLFNCFTF